MNPKEKAEASRLEYLKKQLKGRTPDMNKGEHQLYFPTYNNGFMAGYEQGVVDTQAKMLEKTPAEGRAPVVEAVKKKK